MPSCKTTWAIEREDTCEQPLVRVDETPLASDAHAVAGEICLNALPWRLARGSSSSSSDGQENKTTHCELVVEFEPAQPLQCKVLKLQLASSARHIELHVEGVRRNLLGEDEHSEVYFGTFRGTKTAPTLTTSAAQFFNVSEEFQQTNRDHNVLKCIHKLRIKFVSLTGDKNALELAKFKCLYIGAPIANSQQAAARTTHINTAVGVGINTGALPSSDDVMTLMAGMSLGGMNPQVLLQMIQQMLEREVEAKIHRALDAKLAVLSQRLSFSEQMLLQVQQKSSAKDAQLEHKLHILQQQVAELRNQTTTKEQPQVDATEEKAEAQ